MAQQRFQQLAHWGAFTAVVEDGRLVACEPYAQDPAPSPMLGAMPAMVYSPTRILRPAVRRGWLQGRERMLRGNDAFVEVSWDTALKLVADELARVRGEHGSASIFGGSYGWSSAGRLHHARTQVRRFLFAGGGCTDQAGNYSWGAAQFLLPHVFGTFEPIAKATDWSSVMAHTKLVVAFGGFALKNDQIGSGGCGEHTMAQRLREAKTQGVEFVVVSPLRSDAPASIAAQWVPVRPNADTALLLALAHTLITDNRHDGAFLERYCTGFEAYRRYVMGEADGIAKSPEWAAALCGVPAQTMRDLARRMADTRTMITLAWSLQRSHRGEQPYWAAIALAAMLGQIGLPGGGITFGHGSINGVGVPRMALPSPEMKMGVNPANSAIPVARLTDMLEQPGGEYEFNGRRERYPDIRLVYWAGGNPFHHHQDLNRLRKAWRKPETVVVHDSWWTPTARHADIVLPATTAVERDDIGAGARDRYIFAMQQAIAPVGESRNDYDIFAALAERGGYAERYTEGRGTEAWLREIWRRLEAPYAAAGVVLPSYETFREQGLFVVPKPAREFVLFDDFRADPAAHPLKTPSGKIELYSETIAGFGYEDCPPHPAWLPPAEWLGSASARYPLHLLTIQPPDRLHSQQDPGPVAQAHKIAGREALRLNPADAAARGLANGDLVRVYNARGECLAGVRVDDGLMAGVAVMATGAWYDPAPDGLERNGNANVLCPDIGTSRLTQAPSALSALVEVEKWRGDAPAVEAYIPPALVAA
ncbi:MAG: molybdopterin-dependent oxidoreductase [Burkholderiales bacterium]